MLSIVLLSGPLAGVRRRLDGTLTLGRSPTCELSLDDVKVSRRHSQLELKSGNGWVSDLGSRNGTWLNGVRLEGESVFLVGDRLQVGDTVLVCEEELPVTWGEGKTPIHGRRSFKQLSPGSFSSGALSFFRHALVSPSELNVLLARAARGFRDGLDAEDAAVVLGDTQNLRMAASASGEAVTVPKALVEEAMGSFETVFFENTLVTPLACDAGAPFGFLFCELEGPVGERAMNLSGELASLIAEALARFRPMEEGEALDSMLIGGAKSFKTMMEQARQAAASEDWLLILGETGVGKARLAQQLHSLSSRRSHPFVQVDCARPPEQVDMALFGRAPSPGKPPIPDVVSRCGGGTLLLKNMHRLKGDTLVRLDNLLGPAMGPRVLATARGGPGTPAALTSSLVVGRLEQRFLEVPPLRDRGTDIVPLFEFFCSRFARRAGLEPVRVSLGAMAALSSYSWPGNLHELEAIASRVTALHPGKEVEPSHLAADLQVARDGRSPRALAERVAQVEREAIIEALKQAKGKKIRAASVLGISRPTLDKKIAELGIDVAGLRE